MVGTTTRQRSAVWSRSTKILWGLCLSLLLSLRLGTAYSIDLAPLYAHARSVRTSKGHDAAIPLYRQLLTDHPEDLTASTRIAVAPVDRHTAIVQDHELSAVDRLRYLLRDYKSRAVAELLGIQDDTHPQYYATAPIYVGPLMAGSEPSLPLSDPPTTLECCVALFLLGVALPRETLLRIWTPEDIDLCVSLGVLLPCVVDSSLLVPYVSIMPIDVSHERTIHVATDWHPRVLSTTSIENEGDAVMYIGPDSLALVQHWFQCPALSQQPRSLLDVCTGSGVQALAALALQKASRAVCLDLNTRALRFTLFNAQLNGFEDRIQLVHGDLSAGIGRLWTRENYHSDDEQPLLPLLRSISSSYAMLSANPPFLPVPPSILKERHGLFSSGGPSGEAILASTVELAAQVLQEEGYLAVVSEFFWNQDDRADLLDRIRRWWPGARGILFTNEFPLDPHTYAQRRADDPEEYKQWMKHLEDMDILTSSPGFLFLKQQEASTDLLTHHAVPKSNWGSVWTPSNPAAVGFTSKILSETLLND